MEGDAYDASRGQQRPPPARRTRGPGPAWPGARGGGEPAVVAKRRRDYFKHVEGQLSFEDLLKLAEQQEGEHDGEQVRRDGPQPLGTVAAAAARGDQRSGQLLLEDWAGSGPTDRRVDDRAGGREPARRGLPGQGGPADRGTQPGRGDRPAAAGPAAARAGRQRGPGGERPAAGEHAAAPGDRPQPPDVGADQRRAGGTDPGQLAAPRFRPRGQDDLSPSGSVARIRANLAALAALRAIEREDRPAAPDEQSALARWSGWGAVPDVFDEGKPEFAWAREELSRLATPAELSAAARNTLNAHYTDAALAQAIWTGVQQLGFAGGRVLEAGCGSGNFIGFAPGGARVTGVELDPVTASIAARLYPDADIANESFADTRAPEGSFDLAIGNVPFGSFALTDGRHNPGGHSIHNHFIIKSLHLVRPGGLVAVVTSRYTMDARNPAARREIAALADLAGAVRLPSGAHQRAAGTGVVTDLLIFRRREPDRPPDDTPWEQVRTAELDGAQVPVSEYFLDNPDMVLGTLRAVNGVYNADDLVVTPDGDTVQALEQALGRIASAAAARALTWTPGPAAGTSAAVPLPGPRSAHPDGYLQ